MNWKKNLTIFVVLGLVLLGTLAISGCTEQDDDGDDVLTKPITVVERKEGSGTRETFMNGIGLDSVQSDVKKGENAGVKETVVNSDNAIGYVGLGYISDDAPAIKLDGVMPTEETVGNGEYGITRALHMYTDGEPKSGSITSEFLRYIMSEEGQNIVSEEGFVKVAPNAGPYVKVSGLSGEITVTGSSTVLPIAQAAAEDFNGLYDNVNVQVSGGGSGHGITALAEGNAQIGMASREVKQEEIDQYPNTDFYDNPDGVDSGIGRGGVAVIVSKAVYDAGITELTKDEVKQIYSGEISTWSELE